MLEKPNCSETGAADVERGGRPPDGGGAAQMPDQDDAFTALAANADSALEDRANGHALGILKNLRRNGIVGTLSRLQNSRGVVDPLIHVGGTSEKGEREEEGEGGRKKEFHSLDGVVEGSILGPVLILGQGLRCGSCCHALHDLLGRDGLARGLTGA